MKIFTGLVIALAAIGAQGVEVVKTKFPTPDVVLAESVLSSSEKDSTAEIQQTLDKVGKSGGGTVFLRAGRYVLSRAITIPVGVTLRGDYSRSNPAGGTVLCLTANRGEEDGPAALTVEPGAGVMGLVFWYPEQTLSNPVPYPWTVRTSLHPPCADDNQTVASCRFVNAWKGLSIGPEWNELHTFRNLDICALKTGFAVDSTTDIGRVSEVTVSPVVWTSSALPGAPSEKDLENWLLAHDTVGADYGRSDWEYIWRLRVSGYRTGVRFRKGVRGLTNAVMADSDITSCETALQVDALNGVGLAVYDSRFAGTKATVGLGTTYKNSLVQFNSCAFKGPAVPESPWVSIVNSKLPLVRPEPMTMPRPKTRVVVSVVDCGANPGLDDNGPSFQNALDQAGETGGTVYVPAGIYRFRSNLVVPTGVELRGCTDVPHHTCSGGSVLLPFQGKGDEKGTPFISLQPGSGLRGLGVWYPEEPINAPEPYPWTVRSLGEDCWVVDVNIGNGWQGVDFASAPSGGHRISYLSGNCWRRALCVGNAKRRGWVEDLQFNPHYSARIPKTFPVARTEKKLALKGNRAGGDSSLILRALQEGFVFRDCADEQIRGTFLYATRVGMAFEGFNNAAVLIHGTDTGAQGFVVDQRKGSSLRVALAQLTPFDTSADTESAGIWLAPGDAGESSFVASQFWVVYPTLIQNGTGKVVFDQFNSVSGPVLLRNGAAVVRNGVFDLAMPAHVVVSNCQARVENCTFAHGALKVLDPGRQAVCQGNSLSLSGGTAKIPAEPPFDFRLDCESSSPVAVVENRIARRGGIRKVSAWACTAAVDAGNRVVHFKGHSDDPSYSFLYCEVAAPRIPVYPDTVLDYQFKPLDSLGSLVTIDLVFDDDSVLRESGVSFGYSSGRPRIGSWCSVHVPLGKKTGRTVVSVMVRFDTRRGGGTFEAEIDDIAFSTPNPRANWLIKPVVKEGRLTFDPPYPHPVWYTTDGRNVTASSPKFTGSLVLPQKIREFRWSPSLRTGRPSDLEFGLGDVR